LKKAKDRQGAIRLIQITLRGCIMGNDWEVSRAVARRRIGTADEQPMDREILDLDVEGEDVG
jgi:hypothetical protein